MRCSSCEPLLDAHLEGSLRPIEARAVNAHLHDCDACATLLHELRVVDALLTTARPPGVTADFTAAVVSATSATPLQSPRRAPLGLGLLLYLSVAWAVAIVFALRVHGFDGFGLALVGRAVRDLATFGAAVHVLAPVTPLAAATVTAVLVLDAVLLAALLYGYHRMRPALLLYLNREERS